MSHFLECEAPICQDNLNPNAEVWYASEAVCLKSPYKLFQKKQILINKEVTKGTFRHLDVAYTAHNLETRSI